jgi:NAD(P)-dependent dehydrogenase (short-subunit alcohol dehydrogenase family)
LQKLRILHQPESTHFNCQEPQGLAIGGGLRRAGRSEELIQRLTNDIPLGRLGKPDDIACVVSFLANAESGWINGQVIKANGGRN